MDNYWLSRAASVEAELDNLQRDFEEMQRTYKEQIQNLERQLLEANLNAQSGGTTSENF
jgi:hypothetical protein